MKGFTLIELMIVVGLIVVIGVFGYLNIFQGGRTQELNNTKLSITALLRDAQQRSVSQFSGESWGVRFESRLDRDRYLLFSGSGSSFVTSTMVTIKSYLNFIRPNATSTSIVFRRVSGLPVAEGDFGNCPDVNASSTIRLGIIGEPNNFVDVRVFCNGKIEF